LIWLPAKELNGENKEKWIKNACKDLSLLCDKEITKDDIELLPEEKGWIPICIKEPLTEKE
jgi:hypothetical protein